MNMDTNVPLVRPQLQMYQGPQVKTRYTESTANVWRISRPDTLDLIEDKMETSPEFTGTGKGFLNRTPITQALRPTTGKWDLGKLKSVCIAKDTPI